MAPDILARNRDNISQTVNNLAPFVRVFTNTLGNGRWFDSFVNDLIPTALGGIVCNTATDTSAVTCEGGN